MRAFSVLLRKQFEHLDVGNDGLLDDNELAISNGGENKMDERDANGDGVLIYYLQISSDKIRKTTAVDGK